MQRIADYIADFLVKNGIDTVFSVVGGGAMHLNDAFGHHDGLTVYHTHHEQAAAMAAEGYARINEKPACVCVTTGPGGTNALTGVLCAYQDNVPMIVISGQVRYSTTVESTGLKLRQFGEQEYNIVASATPMTKYAYMVKEPSEIKYVLEKALYLATHGRRGPVWVDVPLNIQGTLYETNDLKGYKIPGDSCDYIDIAGKVLEKLKKAKKPLILAGAGIRRSESHRDFCELVENLRMPVVSPTCVADIFPISHAYYFQNFGIVGGRTGNFLVQNADVIISLGCRLSFNQIGFNYEAFAPQAFKIVVDIDEEELKKPTINIDMPIKADLKGFIKALNSCLAEPVQSKEDWMNYANVLKKRFFILNEVKDHDLGINPYRMIEKLTKLLPENGVIVTGNSTGSSLALDYGVVKSGQRLWGNRNCGTMGYDLPAAIGAAVAKKGMVVCLTGDGSIQMNIQELQTIVLNKIPVKIFIYNNNGYMGIVRTQRNFFNGRLTGCTPESGLDCPDWERIAYAYDIPYAKISNMAELTEKLETFLSDDRYGICEIIEDSEQGRAFKLTSKKLDTGEMVSAPLDELSPPLSEEDMSKYRRFPE